MQVGADSDSVENFPGGIFATTLPTRNSSGMATDQSKREVLRKQHPQGRTGISKLHPQTWKLDNKA